jgi:hypothetical protein
MRFRSVRRVHLFAAMFAPAAGDALSQHAAFAQIPEAPGTYTDADGEIEEDLPVEGMPRRERAEPKPDEPAPDPARDTIDELQRARARASGTPEPESTPRGLNGAE